MKKPEGASAALSVHKTIKAAIVEKEDSNSTNYKPVVLPLITD